ncbi:hypothetical protein BABINDRAFT_161711 [Babjeviella inositovora NRRL Y-12698]|uniref:K Homology domain-containing protein n=1 Tax=Babjeviella inositovora NRRL Y-12698 TaxID=984486 RepID=A0A1E3QQU5_9ASCO|nr:uncharacterized protein BABINDRAFT_161711 [Babjeviella inositovora NRRL Y-12698]ODQ80076.1 hypothetical protein BABINDRAFT_161711 [Babjeviella inositovora NRRL Y-12698]
MISKHWGSLFSVTVLSRTRLFSASRQTRWLSSYALDDDMDEFVAKLAKADIPRKHKQSLAVAPMFFQALRGRGGSWKQTTEVSTATQIEFDEALQEATVQGSEEAVNDCLKMLSQRLKKFSDHYDYILVPVTKRQLSAVKTRLDETAGVFYHHAPLEDIVVSLEKYAKVYVFAETAVTLFQALDRAKMLLSTFQRKFTIPREFTFAMLYLPISSDKRRESNGRPRLHEFMSTLVRTTKAHIYVDSKTGVISQEGTAITISAKDRMGYVKAYSKVMSKLDEMRRLNTQIIELPAFCSPILAKPENSPHKTNGPSVIETIQHRTGTKMEIASVPGSGIDYITFQNERLSQVEAAVREIQNTVDPLVRNILLFQVPEVYAPFFVGFRGVELDNLSSATETDVRIDRSYSNIPDSRIFRMEAPAPESPSPDSSCANVINYVSLAITAPQEEYVQEALRFLQLRYSNLLANIHNFQIPVRFCEPLVGSSQVSNPNGINKISELQFLTDTVIQIAAPQSERDVKAFTTLSVYGDASQVERVVKVVQLRINAFNEFNYPMFIPTQVVNKIRRISESTNTYAKVVDIESTWDREVYLKPYGLELVTFKDENIWGKRSNGRCKQAPFDGKYIIIFAENGEDLITAMNDYIRLQGKHCLVKPI